MSVRKSERGESKIQFLENLREIEIYILRIAKHKPQKYRMLFSDYLVKLSADAYNSAKEGNSIAVTYGSDLTCESDFLFRRKCFQTSLVKIEALISQIEVYYKVYSNDLFSNKELEIMSSKMADTATMLRKIINYDKNQYKKSLNNNNKE